MSAAVSTTSSPETTDTAVQRSLSTTGDEVLHLKHLQKILLGIERTKIAKKNVATLKEMLIRTGTTRGINRGSQFFFMFSAPRANSIDVQTDDSTGVKRTAKRA